MSESEGIIDILIIGAGPAGYTAGIYTSRARRSTVIISGILPGGQLVNTTEVENYPGFENAILGPILMEEMKKQVERAGAKIIYDEVVKVDLKNKPFKIFCASKEYLAKAVIICTGANPRKINVEGEEEFAGKGVSYCATCDGPFFKGLELAVVGGGDSAMEEATFLTKFASTVHIIHRRDKLRASKVMQERAINDPKIKFHWNSSVSKITGDGKVNNIYLKDLNTKQESKLEMGGVFVAIGHDPNSSVFRDHISCNDNGYIICDGTRTSIPGVFAAGDVHDHLYRQAVTAAGFGCMAGIDADKYLAEN